jgi:hypothetical protein
VVTKCYFTHTALQADSPSNSLAASYVCFYMLNSIVMLILKSSAWCYSPNQASAASIEVYRSHTIRHTHTHKHTHTHLIGLFWTSDQLVPEIATYKTHNTEKRQTSMPQCNFNPQSQQLSRCRHMPYIAEPLGMAKKHFTTCDFKTPIRGKTD